MADESEECSTFRESTFYEKFSNIFGEKKKSAKIFFIRKPDSDNLAKQRNIKKGRVFCIARAQDIEIKELTNSILQSLRVKPIRVVLEYMTKFIKENGGYRVVNEKLTRYKHLSYNNNQRFKREIRGVVNNSFFQDFHESDLDHTSKSRIDTRNSQPSQGEIHINNKCIDELEIDLSAEDLEMQSDDVVFFQQLKVTLNSLTNNGIYMDSDSEWVE